MNQKNDIDYDSMSPEELAKLAGVSLPEKKQGDIDYDSMSDEELMKIAGIQSQKNSSDFFSKANSLEEMFPGISKPGYLPDVQAIQKIGNMIGIGPAGGAILKGSKELSSPAFSLAKLIGRSGSNYWRGLKGTDISNQTEKADELANKFVGQITKSKTPQEINSKIDSAIQSQRNSHNDILNKYDEETENLLSQNDKKSQSEAQDLIHDLYSSKSPKEVAEKLGNEHKIVGDEAIELHKNDYKTKNKLYDEALNSEGKEILPLNNEKQVQDVINETIQFLGDLEKRQPGSNFTILEDSIKNFASSPTTRNAHDLQSKLGHIIRKIKERPYNEQNQEVVSNLSDMRDKFLDYLEKNAGQKYKEATRFYKNEYLPWEQDPIISKIVKQGKSSPAIMQRLSLEELDPNANQTPILKLLSKLSPESKKLIVGSKLNNVINRNGIVDQSKLPSAIDSVVRRGFGDFLPENAIEKTNQIENQSNHNEVLSNIRKIGRNKLSEELVKKQNLLKQKADVRKNILVAANKSYMPGKGYSAPKLYSELDKLVKSDISGNYGSNIKGPLDEIRKNLDIIKKHELTAKNARAAKNFLQSLIPGQKAIKIADIISKANK